MGPPLHDHIMVFSIANTPCEEMGCDLLNCGCPGLSWFMGVPFCLLSPFCLAVLSRSVPRNQGQLILTLAFFSSSIYLCRVPTLDMHHLVAELDRLRTVRDIDAVHIEFG
jgi:hypothetical protein